MTNEELFTDLKQFIEATVSQSADGLRKEIKADIKALDTKIDRLDRKVDAIQDGIAETITHANEAMDVAIQGHERRLTRLEHRSA